MKNKNKSSGFTLVELVVVLAIIGLILGVVLASIKTSKAKADDEETRRVISEMALKAEEQEVAPGVVNYPQAFLTINAEATMTALATKLKIAADDYQYVFSPREYAIVFPLKRGGYYCIDSAGKATGKEVVGLFVDGGPYNCDNSTRIVARPDGWGEGQAIVGGDGGGGPGPIEDEDGGGIIVPPPGDGEGGGPIEDDGGGTILPPGGGGVGGGLEMGGPSMP
jgi:prepilin-type N-terminal cleavage/methylation domain-containing protein